MPTPRPVLDHVVINVADALDDAAQTFAKLGFQLTERGHHSLGSSNNLAIFGENYLELLGYEPQRGTPQTDPWAYPAGLSGLVFKPSAQEDFTAGLGSGTVRIEPPRTFSRPVRLIDGIHEARFRTATVSDPRIQNGRVFFCQHQTPELVWRQEWRHHANAVTDITDFTIAAHNPASTVGVFADLFGPEWVRPVDGGFTLEAGTASVLVLDPAEISRRYGGATVSPSDGTDRMVALGFRTASLDKARAALQTGAVSFQTAGERLIVPAASAAGATLTFTE